MAKQTLFLKLSFVAVFSLSLFSPLIIATPHEKPKAPFASYSAQYTLYWHGLRAGVSSQKLTHLEDGSFRLEASAAPSVSFLPYRYNETSYFKVIDDVLMPHQYITKGEEGGKSKEGHLLFDWQHQTVSNVVNRKIWQYPISKGFQDKLTYNLMLRADLLKGSENLKYPVVEDSHFREYHFKHLGKIKLKTTLGLLDTVMVEHTNPLNHRKTKLWLSSKHDFIIVKMEQYRKDKLFIRGEISKLNYPLVSNQTLKES